MAKVAVQATVAMVLKETAINIVSDVVTDAVKIQGSTSGTELMANTIDMLGSLKEMIVLFVISGNVCDCLAFWARPQLPALLL